MARSVTSVTVATHQQTPHQPLHCPRQIHVEIRHHFMIYQKLFFSLGRGGGGSGGGVGLVVSFF